MPYHLQKKSQSRRVMMNDKIMNGQTVEIIMGTHF